MSNSGNHFYLLFFVSPDWKISASIHRHGHHHIGHIGLGVHSNETRRAQSEPSQK